ncbi:hypothetical protein KJA15_00815 [Patescibacteria group bacterium]|nr:hypothetical protein [Patescibacteria group bacterium]
MKSNKRKKAQKIKKEMIEYCQGLKKLRDEKQKELKSKKDSGAIEKLRQEIKEIDEEIAKLEDFIEWMEESGEELEVEEIVSRSGDVGEK